MKHLEQCLEHSEHSQKVVAIRIMTCFNLGNDMIKLVCCEMITVTSQRGTNGFTVVQCGEHLNVHVYWLQVNDEMVLR